LTAGDAGLLGLLGGGSLASARCWLSSGQVAWAGSGHRRGRRLDALAFGRAHAGAAQALVDGEEVAEREVGAGEEVVDAGPGGGLVVVGEGADEADGLQLGEAPPPVAALSWKCDEAAEGEAGAVDGPLVVRGRRCGPRCSTRPRTGGRR
jgi:hypothetical protein